MIYHTYWHKLVWGLLLLLALSACHPGTPEGTISSPIVHSTHQYRIQQELILDNQGTGQPEKQNLWVALIRDVSPYQTVLSRKITPRDYTLVIDEYGNEYAEFDFSDHPAGTQILVEIEYRVEVNELNYNLENCEDALSDEVEDTAIWKFTQPEVRIESANPQIVALSEDLSRGTKNNCERTRAFYDFVADELVYGYNKNDWGAQAALGPMGADCTEYSSLMAALNRAAGIPARYFEGLLFLEKETANLAKTEHAWIDMYLPSTGWTPADPTLGRPSVFRETYFAHYTPDHIIVTVGRNPSTLRGASYWSHIYWPGDSTKIQLKTTGWQITRVE